MQVVLDPINLKPPRTGRWSMPVVLAVAAHLLLIAALTWGVRWNQTAQPVTFDAELWSSVAQQAAPRAVQPPPPKPIPKPVSKPEPAPEVKPKVAPPPPDTREADIAIEQAKKKKEDTKKREADRKAAKDKADEEKTAKAEQDRKAAAEKQKKKTDVEAAQKVLDEKIQQIREKKEADAAAKLRNDAINRMLGQADATGDANATGTAKRSSGPTAAYKQRLSLAFKRNIVFTNPESISGNPQAEVQVTISPGGRVMSARLTRSSGVPAWDDAVLRAAEKTTIPADENGHMPSGFPVVFGPKD